MQNKTISCDCLVVGGGPAGLSAAMAAAGSGAATVLAEYLPSPGRKLLASVPEVQCDESTSARRVRAPLSVRTAFCAAGALCVSAGDMVWFLSSNGVPVIAPDNFHCFPKSMRAGDVLELLLGRCRALGSGC